jgi:hypothetical protein
MASVGAVEAAPQHQHQQEHWETLVDAESQAVKVRSPSSPNSRSWGKDGARAPCHGGELEAMY